jgi:F-type H+-transporting ATPase subunit epsilon
MADTFQLEVVTPEKILVRDTAEEIQIPGKDGFLGVLPGHAPLITELAIGEISYKRGGETHRLSVAWGFAEVLPDRVTILAETAEKASEINVQRAEVAKTQAAQALANPAPDLNYAEAENALKRAETRLEVAGKKS